MAVLTRYLPKAKVRKQKNLLNGGQEEEPEEAEEPQQVSLFALSLLPWPILT